MIKKSIILYIMCLYVMCCFMHSLAFSQTVSVGVRPFSCPGLTTDQVRKEIQNAMDELSSVCGVKLIGSSNPDIYIFGVTKEWSESTFPSLKQVKNWSAFTYNRAIYFRVDIQRNARRFRMEVIHEIMHTKGYPNDFRYGHTPFQNSYTGCIMHPHGSIDYFFCPSEVISLQARYGKPKYKFQVIEIDDISNRINKQKAKWQKLSRERDWLVKQREKYRGKDPEKFQTYHGQARFMNKKTKAANELLVKYVNQYHSAIKKWSKVPMANVHGHDTTILKTPDHPRMLKSIPDLHICNCFEHDK